MTSVQSFPCKPVGKATAVISQYQACEHLRWTIVQVTLQLSGIENFLLQYDVISIIDTFGIVQKLSNSNVR